jgi:hypothetical protein
MALQADWKEFLSLLNSNRVRYVVVGAHALAAHGQPRFTGDLDVLVEPTAANAKRVLEVLRLFGFGSLKISQSDLDRPGMVIRLGQAPVGIDLLTSISGVAFNSAWKNRVRTTLGGVRVAVLSVGDFVRNKKAAGRPKDLLDVELLRPRRTSPRR